MNPSAAAAVFTSWAFINFAIPAITVIGGVYVKVVSRRTLSVNRDDFAVGFDIALGALVLFVVKMVNASRTVIHVADAAVRDRFQAQLIAMPWMLLFWIAAFWGMSTVVRQWGWESVGGAQPQSERLTFVGVGVPIAFGLASLLLAVLWTGGDT
jgi:hypothetical protein